jgi:hypothetical protein
MCSFNADNFILILMAIDYLPEKMPKGQKINDISFFSDFKEA